MHEHAQSLADTNLNDTACDCGILLLHKAVLSRTVENLTSGTSQEVHLHLACPFLCFLDNFYPLTTILICNSTTGYFV